MAVAAAQASGLLPAIDVPAVEIQRPKQPEHGDYSSNIALVVSSAVKKATGQKANPRQIAQSIVDQIPTDDLIGGVELAGPGFINIRLNPHWLQSQALAIIAEGPRFGSIEKGVGQRWQVEYVSANPTGPAPLRWRAQRGVGGYPCQSAGGRRVRGAARVLC